MAQSEHSSDIETHQHDDPQFSASRSSALGLTGVKTPLFCTKDELNSDRVSLIAAGVALCPAITALKADSFNPGPPKS